MLPCPPEWVPYVAAWLELRREGRIVRTGIWRAPGAEVARDDEERHPARLIGSVYRPRSVLLQHITGPTRRRNSP